MSSGTDTSRQSSSSSGRTGIHPQHRSAIDLCQTLEIPVIPSNLIDSLNSVRLGQGTYGHVEKAKYRKTQTDDWIVAAIKFTNERHHVKMLIQEAKVMMSLRAHPNITKIHGIYECPKYGTGLVMEHMDCKSMADLLRNRNIEYTIDHFASWMYQLSSAVDYFHSHQVLHRDLKTQNMLLTNRYRTIKVCDFGTFTTIKASMTANCGTPITMAPEVFRGEKNYHMKSDIYSIGIVMWQILSREDPYKGVNDRISLLYNVAMSNLRPHPLECSYILSGFYERCWDGDQEIRPTSKECKEFFNLLREEYPNGNEPLFDKTTNREVSTPQPAFRYSKPATSKSEPNNGKLHRRTGSDQTTMLRLNVPDVPVLPDTSSPALRETRSKSVASHLSTAANHSAASTGSPHRNAPPRPVHHKLSNEEEMRNMWISDPNLEPVEPDVRDEVSLSIYNKHCDTCVRLVETLNVRKQILAVKHENLSKWEKLDHKKRLKDRIAFLKEQIKINTPNTHVFSRV